MKELEAIRAEYHERWTKVMIQANTSDEKRKENCLRAASYYARAEQMVHFLIAQ